MRSPRVFFSLDRQLHQELSARANRLGMHPNYLARDMLLAALNDDDCPTLSAQLDKYLRALSEGGHLAALGELRERLAALQERLSAEASGPGHDALWDLLETVLEWSIRTCVYVDHLVGLQLNDREQYRHFNRRTAETSRRLLASALRGDPNR